MTNEIGDFETRLRAIEDRLEIQNLLAAHAPSIDGGAAESWLANWSDDALVDRHADPERHSGDYAGVYGKDLMLEEINSPELAALRKAGLCHLNTPPYIAITGDEAKAINYLQLVGLEGDTYRVRRIVLSLWHFRRTGEGWKIARRKMRALGLDEAVQIMLEVER